MALLDVENGRNVYYEHHCGTGRPIVLVHGWAADDPWAGGWRDRHTRMSRRTPIERVLPCR